MICFRDMTFCSAKCLTMNCRRNFTPQQEAAAKRWWSGMKGEPPIMMSDFDRDCTDYVPAKD